MLVVVLIKKINSLRIPPVRLMTVGCSVVSVRNTLKKLKNYNLKASIETEN
jgi:hypothetical protein